MSEINQSLAAKFFPNEDSILIFDDENVQRLANDYLSLERKLGSVEYENTKLQAEIKKLTEESEALISRRVEAEKDFKKVKESEKKLELQYKKSVSIISSMKHYIRELPLREEYEKVKKEAKSKSLEVEQLQEKVEDRENELQKANSRIRNLSERLDETENESVKYKEELRLIEDRKKEASRLNEEEVHDIIWERNQLRKDFRSISQVLETNREKLSRTEKSLKTISSKLENTSAEKQTEVQRNHRMESQILALEEELKKLKQELQEEKQERAKVEILKEENDQFSRCLHLEMQLVMREMRDLIKFCEDGLNSQDPNVSLLLGSPCFDEEELPSVKQQMEQLRSLRTQMRSFQQILSDKCAEKLGEKLAQQSCYVQ